jgi:hypothetical protein
MKYLKKKVVLKYLYDQLTGNFTAFLVGMLATTLVSGFFEKRSIKNLWGLTSKKAVVDKQTYTTLELMVSIIIGFIVFEIMTKVVKERLDRNLPVLRFKLLRWLVRRRLKTRLAAGYHNLRNRKNRILEKVGNSVSGRFSGPA